MEGATAVDYLYSPGYRNNLTPSQTLALFKLWRRFLRLCEITSHSSDSIGADTSLSPPTATTSHRASSDSLRRNLGRKAHTSASEPAHSHSAASSASHHELDPKDIPKDDRLKEHLRHLEESKEMQSFLLKHGGAALRREFWVIVKGEHPDAYMLRCLRARKWDVDRALAIIGSTCAFRVQYDISGIMKSAELGLTSTRGGFNIMHNGISYVYGATSAGEPVYFIEVGSHYSSNQTAEELKRGVILLQESLQILMPPPVERKVVIFNLNNFGLRNMDWSIVLFMAKTMESFYPETLARVYVHGAPWIFKPIWSILRPLLDPVVREKVKLTWKVEELADYVPAEHLPKDSMHGGLDWTFSYPPPDEGENDIQKDEEKAEELGMAYRTSCMEFEYATRALSRAYAEAGLEDGVGGVRGKFAEEDWEPDGVASLRANRDILATKVRVAWLKLKPYIIGTLKYDRWKVIDREGVIRWKYRTVEGKEEEQVLGEGTSLSVLERNLAELEALTSTAPAVKSTKRSRERRPVTAQTDTTPPPILGGEKNGNGKAEEARRDSVAYTAHSKLDSTEDSSLAPFEEVIPIHPSQLEKMGQGARDGDGEVQ